MHVHNCTVKGCSECANPSFPQEIKAEIEDIMDDVCERGTSFDFICNF